MMNKNVPLIHHHSFFAVVFRLFLEGDDERVKVPSHYLQYLFLSLSDSRKNASLFSSVRTMDARGGRERKRSTGAYRIIIIIGRTSSSSSPHRVSRYSSFSRSYRRRTKFGTAAKAKASGTFVESAKKSAFQRKTSLAFLLARRAVIPGWKALSTFAFLFATGAESGAPFQIWSADGTYRQNSNRNRLLSHFFSSEPVTASYS